MTEEKNVPKSNYYKYLLVFSALVVVIWIGYFYFISNYLFPNDLSSSGLFGDMFGGINALFSGMAFAGIILTIYLQKRELALQREELVLQREELFLTRKEIKGQKEQLEAQNKTLKHQNFENTFFQLLALHNQIVEAMKFGQPATTGRACFKHWYGKIEDYFNDHGRRNTHRDLSERDYANVVYKVFKDNFQNYVGHYFRTLYNIFKFINNSDVENKTLYANLVRAQLSSYELALIFYNCLSSIGRDKFKPLVEEYGVLKHIDPGHILRDSLRTEYAESAFE